MVNLWFYGQLIAIYEKFAIRIPSHTIAITIRELQGVLAVTWYDQGQWDCILGVVSGFPWAIEVIEPISMCLVSTICNFI